MLIDTNYQVIRQFGGYPVGKVLTNADFVNPQRAAQLIDQRYLTAVVAGSMQPTVASLLGATVRKSMALIDQVRDRCLLVAALEQETRETVRVALEKRIQEMDDGE